MLNLKLTRFKYTLKIQHMFKIFTFSEEYYHMAVFPSDHLPGTKPVRRTFDYYILKCNTTALI